MLNKFTKVFKNVNKNIPQQPEIVDNMNFKGQRQKQITIGQGPLPTREQYEQQYRLDPEIRMQSRSLRLKNFGYLCLFMGWYVVLFITHRLRSDDLETLEKEAEQRIKLQKDAKKLKNI